MIKSSEESLKPEEKLEWVTPKISLMDAEDTEGTKVFTRTEIDPASPQSPS